MQHLIDKYLTKLQSQGLARRDKALFLFLDAELASNSRLEGDTLQLGRVFDLMSINTIFFAEPAEPYKGIIDEITRYDSGCRTHNRIIPNDCETRTFFHDIPVIDDLSPGAVTSALSHRKSAIVKNRGIVTYGMVSPEQAFVSFSSACFSTFVKYFSDSLGYFEHCAAENLKPDPAFIRNFNSIADIAEATARAVQDDTDPQLSSGPPQDEDAVTSMLAEAGRAVVKSRLVDSFFGNISYVHKDTIYISQTGSSLDELEACIDAVPLDNSSSVGITASSELPAHKRIYSATGDHAILHGHPKFSVILSMYCGTKACKSDICYRACPEERDVCGIPVVPGEVGTGPTGLVNTVPAAMKKGNGAIVYGHGVFTSGDRDFRKPFHTLLAIEKKCREEYFALVGKFLERCR